MAFHGTNPETATIIPSKITAMRRKSRVLLCFAVLWVLGIAYYFYSGTTLSRKVGFSVRFMLYDAGSVL